MFILTKIFSSHFLFYYNDKLVKTITEESLNCYNALTDEVLLLEMTDIRV